MKKLSVLVLALVLLVALGSVTMASTMGVAVSEGQSVTFEYYSQSGATYSPYVDYNWANDTVKFTVGYQFNGEDNDASLGLGARYEFSENFAGTAKISKSGEADPMFAIGARGKYGFSDTVAATGYLTFNSGNDVSYEDLFVQGEFTVAEGFFLTAGYGKTFGDLDYGYYGVGAEYAFDKWDLYLDYSKSDVDGSEALITFGVNYTL